jgi:diaminopimelate epimerase
MNTPRARVVTLVPQSHIGLRLKTAQHYRSRIRLNLHRPHPAELHVDEGVARTGWAEIPLREACDTLHVPLALGPLTNPVATNIGNPHATFFVADVDEIDLATLGPQLERHPIFPQRANIGVAHVTPAGGLRLRVWERGVGITRACGTGACAAMVAAVRRGLTGRRAAVVLDGGPLEMEWRADGHVMMTGAIATSFSGFLDASLLG